MFLISVSSGRVSTVGVDGAAPASPRGSTYQTARYLLQMWARRFLHRVPIGRQLRPERLGRQRRPCFASRGGEIVFVVVLSLGEQQGREVQVDRGL